MAAGAVWAHAGKTGIIVAAAIAVVAAFAPAFADRRLAVVRAVLALALVIGAVLLMFVLFPQLERQPGGIPIRSGSTQGEHERMADRGSSGWRGATVAGVRIGGVTGAGTGAGSLGLQYLGEGAAQGQVTGVEQVEGGYASVGQQWGVIGLLLWLGWTTSLGGTALATLQGSPRDLSRRRGLADHFLGGHLPIRGLRRWVPVLPELLRERVLLAPFRCRARAVS